MSVTHIGKFHFKEQGLLELSHGTFLLSTKNHSDVHHVAVIRLNDFVIEAFREIFPGEAQ